MHHQAMADAVEQIVRKRPASSASKDARARRSAAALRDALLKLLEQQPYEQISIRDICAASGVHYATYFRHYAGKEELLDAIAQEQIAHLSALALAARGATDYRAALLALCVYVDEHRRLWSALLNGGAAGAMREEWVRQSMAVAQNEQPAHAWLPRELGTIVAATLIAETLAWWVRQPPGQTSPEAAATLLYRLLGPSVMPE